MQLGILSGHRMLTSGEGKIQNQRGGQMELRILGAGKAVWLEPYTEASQPTTLFL